MTLSVGESFAGYIIERALGAGGMGAVYLAVENYPRRKVALKVLHSNLTSEEAIRRFRSEIDIIGKLDHPNILPLYRADVEGNRPWMALRFVDGGELSLYMRTTPLTSEGMRWLECVAAALDHAHDNGVIHRDIKPSNVMISRSQHVYLADFGIARSLDHRTRLTSDGVVVGTPAYMAPEQIQGDEITSAADVYSLAIICFEWLAGEPPFCGDSPLSTCIQHLQNPVPLHKLKNCPPAVVDVLRIALAKNPRERVLRASILVNMLRVALNLGVSTQQSSQNAQASWPPLTTPVIEKAASVATSADNARPSLGNTREIGKSQSTQRTRPTTIRFAAAAAIAMAAGGLLLIRYLPWESKPNDETTPSRAPAAPSPIPDSRASALIQKPDAIDEPNTAMLAPSAVKQSTQQDSGRTPTKTVADSPTNKSASQPAAATDPPYSQRELEKAYRDFDRREYKLAYPVLKKAADDGVHKAQYDLAIMYLYGHIVKADFEKARELFESSLPSCKPDEIFSIGAAFDGIRNEPPKGSYDRKMHIAVHFYEIASKRESGKAQYALARLATNRDDGQDAIKWLNKAVANKHPHATYQLGRRYYDGTDVPKDTSRGLELIRAARTLGDDFATVWLEKNPP